MAHGDAAIVLRSIDSERGVVGDLARILGHDATSAREELGLVLYADIECFGHGIPYVLQRLRLPTF